MAIDSTSTDRYTPAPDTTECPHCGATFHARLYSDAEWIVVLQLRCAGCQQTWTELRPDAGQRDGAPVATRTWLPAVAIVPDVEEEPEE